VLLPAHHLVCTTYSNSHRQAQLNVHFAVACQPLQQSPVNMDLPAELSAEVASSFKYVTAKQYQAPAPSIRTFTSDARASDAAGSTSVTQNLSEPAEQSAAPRALFPGLSRSVDRPTPFTISGKGKGANQDIAALVEDSGRKSLTNITEGGVGKNGGAQDGAVQQNQVSL
jgi:hypothetical protein